MKHEFQRMLRRFLMLGITKVPSNAKAVISDLFFWSNIHDITTFFEYIGPVDFFNASLSSFHDECSIIFFDSNGTKISSNTFTCSSLSKISIDISKITRSFESEYGTFSVFHSNIPSTVLASSSFLAERGYVGYSLRSSFGKSYVHGNLDAVACYKGVIEPLGNTSFSQKLFFLQSIFSPDEESYIALVNHTSITNKIDILAIPLSESTCSNYFTNFLPCDEFVKVKSIDLNSLGSLFFRIPSNLCPCRIVIKSHLPMARPTCFVIAYNHLDVYHG